MLFAIAALTTTTALAAKTVKFTKEIADDATYALYQTLMDNKIEAGTTIEFEKGVYHFHPEKAHEQFCYISNHNDELSRIAFPIFDADGITIEGNGSTFIFHGRLIPFWMENSKDVRVNNITIDFDVAFHSEGVVVATNEAEKSVDIKFSDEYPYEIRNGKIYFIKPYYQHDLGQVMFYDPKTGGPSYQTENHALTVSSISKDAVRFNPKDYKYKTDSKERHIGGRGSLNALEAVEISPNVVRFYGQRKAMPPVGMILTTKGGQDVNRFAPAFKGHNVTNFNAENVTVHHAGGMAFLFENCENIDIYKSKVVPSNGRVVSSTADATHFVGCRGKVSLRDCVFHGQLDDAMNVHGTYQEVMDVLDKHTVGVRMGHYQQLGFQLAKPGDKIGVVRLSESFHAYETLTVKSVKFINGRYQRITFNEELPSRISDADLLENLSAYPEVLVENCDMSRNRARGILLSTPVKTVIRNNYFGTEMTAILLPVESSSWYESGNATNVLIEGNTFQDCVTGGMDAAVIRFVTDDESPNTAFSNIEIKNNTFNHIDNLVLEVSNVDGLLFEGNTITHSDTYPQQFPNQPAIRVQYSKNIKFKKNNYEGKATTIVESVKGMEELKFK